MGDKDPDIDCRLVDLTRIDLAQLEMRRDSVLDHALRRVMRAAENPDEATFSFQQSI